LSTSTAAVPLRRAHSTRSTATAGADDEPGNASPRASPTTAMVLAVYMPPQEPMPGQATRSTSSSSSSVAVPSATRPTAS